MYCEEACVDANVLIYYKGMVYVHDQTQLVARIHRQRCVVITLVISYAVIEKGAMLCTQFDPSPHAAFVSTCINVVR